MKISCIRALLAIVSIGAFMIITTIMALYPLFSRTNVELTQYADYFVKIASIYTGILGVIIGFYFGRRYEKKQENGTTK
jgi:positive regulator of sigma E activity